MNETQATIAIAAAVQIGTLIWFLSDLRTLVRQHDKRLDNVEAKAEATAMQVAAMKEREWKA